jgi:hypothetical protein
MMVGPRSPAGRHLRRGFCYPRPTMVIVRRRLKAQHDPNQKHDFAKDQERCAKCNMTRRVWNDTRVPCPGKPYGVSTNRPLTRIA